MKCRQCGKEINKDAAIQIKPRIYVCSADCEQKYEYKNVKSTQNNKDDLIELKSYISQLYNGEVNWPLIMKQLRQMREEYGYKNSGILYTLKYAHDIKEIDFNGSGIGLVPYLYNEAKNFYNQLSQVKKSVDNLQNICYDEVTIVKKINKQEDVFE